MCVCKTLNSSNLNVQQHLCIILTIRVSSPSTYRATCYLVQVNTAKNNSAKFNSGLIPTFYFFIFCISMENTPSNTPEINYHTARCTCEALGVEKESCRTRFPGLHKMQANQFLHTNVVQVLQIPFWKKKMTAATQFSWLKANRSSPLLVEFLVCCYNNVCF